jgi:alkylation response protein AidB-like acyl-CoA dehydrogenase
MNSEIFTRPLDMLRARLPDVTDAQTLEAYQTFWIERGIPISEAVDRQGTPTLRMFDRFGQRVDEILYPPDYWTMLREGYRAGVVWHALEDSLVAAYLLGYITCFYDPGLYCPYVVSLSTAVPLAKYGSEELRARFLPPLLRHGNTVWQGATWMTEAKGGSDLGMAVETRARDCGTHWELTGDKYFSSNVGAELAVVAARPEDAPNGVRGLELFLVPRLREDGTLNYLIRRLKNKIGTRSVPTGEVELHASEAYLLGRRGTGVYLILDTLNFSRVANSIGSVALAQRALAEAWNFAQGRVAFGKPIAQHPLLRRQFEERAQQLDAAFALAWESVALLNNVWRETPPYSAHYHLFRLVAHLAKYWTAELAVQFAKWAMEVHGAAGIISEYPVERLLREAMILPIWEGTPHRQMLDGMEVMERKQAHRLLFDYLVERGASAEGLRDLQTDVETWLALPNDEREAEAEGIFQTLAARVAQELARHSG